MTPEEIGAYCRQVEQHLTRINGGHLVRVVGPAFDLVRGWADAGVPLSVVFRGIERKAERHGRGVSRRPLRIEFCDADVRELFDDWRRAIGAPAANGASIARDAVDPDDALHEEPAHAPSSRSSSLSKHLGRAVERLTRAASRLQLSDDIRDLLSATLSELTAIREHASGVRGSAKAEVIARLDAVERSFQTKLRAVVSPATLRDLESTADQELAPFRSRLTDPAWREAHNATVDRLLRDRLDVPQISWSA